MVQGPADGLVEFLERQAGDHLRGVIQYSENDYSSLYMRTDIDDLYPDEKMEDLCDYYRKQSTVQNAEEPFSLGNCHCNVSVYDDAILCHFAQGDDIGTVITLEPEAGRDIVGFITECLKLLHLDSPQTIENVPTWLQD